MKSLLASRFVSGPFLLALLAAFFVPLFITQAQTGCGDIVVPANHFWPDSSENRTPIADCTNPFNADETVGFTAELRLGGQVVTDGATISIEAGQTTVPFSFSMSPESFDFPFSIYRKAGPDYVLEYPKGFSRSFSGDMVLIPGEYIAVITYEDEPILNQNSKDNLLAKLTALVFPVAAAYYPSYVEVQVINFTVVAVEPPPAGASSVLFLPGIQASRLYLEEGGEENRLWEPNINADVEKLALDENGNSINQVYTRDVVDRIFGISSVYQTFINQMKDLRDDEMIIKDFEAFAYDWRFSVEDVVTEGVQYEDEIKNLVAAVETMAGDSFTEKVTIIAHSNGGLVGKALISELENQGKHELIDKFVMVGTPQLGTPKAIGVMLHGLDQKAGGGIIVDDVTARNIIKNMPGAYSLLPSPKYFEKSDETVVTADSSSATAQIQAYGPIDSAGDLKNFLLDVNDTRDANPPQINQPNVLNDSLFTKHEMTQSRLDNWQAPNGVSVYEVVGTGISTIRGFEYRAFPCFAVICAFSSQMKPYPLFSDDGDETVMAISAGGYDGDKVTAKIDLAEEGDGILNLQYQHPNLTESPTVQEFVDSIIRFPYVSETVVIPPDFIEVTRKYTIIGVHSPVTLSVEDENGLKVGRDGNRVNEEIPGSQYIELGGSTYIVLPADTEYTATVQGVGEGVYSLTIDSLSGDEQTSEFSYIGASTSPTMKATFTASSSGFSTIKTDTNGDGVVDLEQTLDGEIVVPSVVYTYLDLRNAVAALNVPRVAKQLLLLQVTLAERFDQLAIKQLRQQMLEQKTLQGIEGTLRIMEKKKLISTAQLENIIKIVNYLKQ